jgi:nicotinamidase-related amidase
MAFEPTSSVLLVVDVQNDFCPGGNLAVEAGDEVVPIINKLAGRFSKVVATQDWHPRDHVSFASSHPGRRPFEVIRLGDIEQVLWPDHCVPGTAGAEFHPDLDARAFDLIVRKGTNRQLDSYSAFFENDRKTATGLHFYLQGLGLSSVYLAGLALDVCVYFSALDARRLGFEVFLIEDACRGIDTPPGTQEDRLGQMREAGVRIVKAGEVG